MIIKTKIIIFYKDKSTKKKKNFCIQKLALHNREQNQLVIKIELKKNMIKYQQIRQNNYNFLRYSMPKKGHFYAFFCF